jgi:hydrogenase expression/formation protein HypE
MTSDRRFPVRLDLKKGAVDMSHGSGGRAMAQLIGELFQRYLDNELLTLGNDQALFTPPPGRLVMSTDGHVISPLFFPGGDIGSLAVHGTINDVAMAGARPLYLAAGFILEEGFPARRSRPHRREHGQGRQCGGCSGGDRRHQGGGARQGRRGLHHHHRDRRGARGHPDLGDRAEPGDAILVSGSMGDHGVAILSKRENLGFETEIRSDSAALHELVAAMVAAVPDIHCLRDPTRGGLATTLNELAHQSGVGMQIREDAIPVAPRWPPPASCSGSTRSMSPTRAS